MTTSAKDFTQFKTPYLAAGWAAIASGVFGIAGVVFLIAYLVLRSANSDQWVTMNALHDVSVIVQMLFLIPVVSALYRRSLQSTGMRKSFLIMGVVGLLCTALFLLFGRLKIIADVLYMFPQGIVGIWILMFCLRKDNKLARGHKWFGVVVGIGLALVGIFPLQYALFVDTIMLDIPAATPEQVANVPINRANMIVHQILFIGSPMGVLTLPFWTLWLGYRLGKERSFVPVNPD